MLAVTLIFATDMHHLVIGALHDSYTLFAPGCQCMRLRSMEKIGISEMAMIPQQAS